MLVNLKVIGGLRKYRHTRIPLPSLIMGNAQSLSNKVDEISVDTLETEPFEGNIVHTPLNCHRAL